MGGDLGPSEVIAAVKLALADETIDPIVLVGDQAVLEPLLVAAGLKGHLKVSIVHASEVIAQEDKPLQALKRKKDSSMVRAIDLVKNGEARVAISCGNTGALMAGSTLRLRMMAGVDRPALAAVIPRAEGHFVLIDAGANPESKPEHLMHNAILGANYAKVILGVANPRVGLITIGTEEGKGNSLIADTHEQLKKIASVINYVGPIEGFQVFRNTVDVVVCDGFVGNTLLKTWESLAKFITTLLKEEIRANPLRMVGALLAKGAFDALKTQMNPDQSGGASLLGVRGNILKTHGSSNRQAIASAIRAAGKIIHQDLYHHIERDIARANELVLPPPAADAAAN